MKINPYWLVGFTDGEGCFNIDIHCHSEMTHGLQIQPEFIIVQHERDVQLLHAIKEYLGVGSVKVNHRDSTSVRHCYYCKNIKHLAEKIIPFFEKYNLLTKKSIEFERFKYIVLKMQQGYDKQSLKNFVEIVELGQSLRLNPSASSRKLKKPSKVQLKLDDLRKQLQNEAS